MIECGCSKLKVGSLHAIGAQQGHFHPLEKKRKPVRIGPGNYEVLVTMCPDGWTGPTWLLLDCKFKQGKDEIPLWVEL